MWFVFLWWSIAVFIYTWNKSFGFFTIENSLNMYVSRHLVTRSNQIMLVDVYCVFSCSFCLSLSLSSLAPISKISADISAYDAHCCHHPSNRERCAIGFIDSHSRLQVNYRLLSPWRLTCCTKQQLHTRSDV